MHGLRGPKIPVIPYIDLHLESPFNTDEFESYGKVFFERASNWTVHPNPLAPVYAVKGHRSNGLFAGTSRDIGSALCACTVHIVLGIYLDEPAAFTSTAVTKSSSPI